MLSYKEKFKKKDYKIFLKIYFEDDFEDISKGKKGGDRIQTINYKNKTKIAKIYFESKDVKSFSEEWPDKLLKDMNAKGVANGIIVCSLRCMPKDYSKRISKVNSLKFYNYYTFVSNYSCCNRWHKIYINLKVRK